MKIIRDSTNFVSEISHNFFIQTIATFIEQVQQNVPRLLLLF